MDKSPRRRRSGRRPQTITLRLERHHLTVIGLALETHERVAIERAGGNPSTPPAIAARRTRAHLHEALGPGDTFTQRIDKAFRRSIEEDK